MLPNGLTKAQVELLDYCSHLEADSLYSYLSDTLSLSISGYTTQQERRDPNFSPSADALEAWFFTLGIMNKLHNLAVEGAENTALKFGDNRAENRTIPAGGANVVAG